MGLEILDRRDEGHKEVRLRTEKVGGCKKGQLAKEKGKKKHGKFKTEPISEYERAEERTRWGGKKRLSLGKQPRWWVK